jgi:hypothetical protein
LSANLLVELFDSDRSAFVITAYDLGPKALKALRRRQRRRQKK